MKFLRKIALTIVVLLTGAAGAWGQKMDDIRDFSTIVTNLSYGSADLAAKQIASQVRKYPDDDALHYYHALSLMMAGKDMDTAVSELEKAVAIDSSNYWYRYYLGAAYQQKGDIEKTVALYEALAKDYPKKNDILYVLVNLYLQQGMSEKSLAGISDIDMRMGKTDPTAVTKFNILCREGRQDEAIKELEEYAEDYSSPQAYCVLADYALSIDRDSSSLNYFNAALRMDPYCAPARMGLMDFYRITGNTDDYFKTLNAIIADKDVEVEVKNDYLKNLLERGGPRFIVLNKERFDSTLSLGLAVHPLDSGLASVSGTYWYVTGNSDKAIETFRRNMDNYPESESICATYLQALYAGDRMDELAEEGARAYGKFGVADFMDIANYAEYQRENYDAIISNCEKLLASAPADSIRVRVAAYSTIGECQYQMGEKEKCYATYNKALKLDPEYAPVLNNYAYFLSEEGRKLKKAYAMSKKTVSLEPDNATYLDTFAWILHLMGKDVEAKPFFKHAMLYGGRDSALILEHYAEVLDALGEKDLATTYRTQAEKKLAEGKE